MTGAIHLNTARACDAGIRSGLPLSERLAKQIEFILEVDRLKSIVRRTPLLDCSRQETDAEHSWHVTLMAVVLAEYSEERIDVPRVVTMLLVHDLVEIDAGDTFIYDDAAVGTQAARQREAADRIFSILPDEQGRYLLALWEEFEAQDSPDAKFAKAMDRLQPLLHNYFTHGGTWKAPGVTQDRVIERKELIGRASTELWAYAQSLIQDATRQGFLRPPPTT